MWFEYEILIGMSMKNVIEEEEPIGSVLSEWLEYEHTCIIIILINDRNA